MKRYLFILIAFFSMGAMAHDYWLMPMEDGKTHVLVYGHADRWDRYNPEWVKSATGYDLDGKAFPIQIARQALTFSEVRGGKSANDFVTVSSEGAGIIVILFDEGYWTQIPGTPEEWYELSRVHVKTYGKSNYYRTASKTLFVWGATYDKPVGADLEIVPLSDPWKSGLKELPIQVFYRGKPLVQGKVEIDGNPKEFITDAQGKTKIPLTERGRQHIVIRHTVPVQGDPNAEGESVLANLVFTRK